MSTVIAYKRGKIYPPDLYPYSAPGGEFSPLHDALQRDGVPRLVVHRDELLWRSLPLTDMSILEIAELEQGGQLIWTDERFKDALRDALPRVKPGSGFASASRLGAGIPARPGSGGLPANSNTVDSGQSSGGSGSGSGLMIAGGVLVVLGIIIAIGNLSGGMPTFAFAGFITGIIGMVLIAAGRGRAS